MDNKFLALIQLLLKAGVEIDGVVHPTTKGVPQGGVVSPLLANIVLNKLDWFLHSKGFHDASKKRAAIATTCRMSGSAAMPTTGACFLHDPIGSERNCYGTRSATSFGKPVGSNCPLKRPGLPT